MIIVHRFDFKERYYDPFSQKFLSEDPIGFLSGDLNLYRYAFNSPLNYIDPYGWNSIIMSPADDVLTKPGSMKPRAPCFNENQRALVDLAQKARRNGLTAEEAATMNDWANEYNLRMRGPEMHHGRPQGSNPHYHIGPITIFR